MSARRGAEWMRNGFRIVADRPHAHARVYLPDCPIDCARVAVLIPPERVPEAYVLAGAKFGRVVGAEVRVRLFAEDVPAQLEDVTDAARIAATKARYVVVMPPRVTNDD